MAVERREKEMYVWGTANPTGESDESYRGLYLRNRDISAFIQELPGKPVKVEHAGEPVGSVVHAWENNRRGLDCILEINRTESLDGAVIASLIGSRCANELSLSYRVRMDNSGNASGGVPHLEKEIVEVSIVKRGLRPGCHIHAFSK
jgi:hypothetical protein